MADFQEQVEDLVGTIYNADTTALTQWLVDGVHDVTNRSILANPREIEKFIRESGQKAANEFDIGGSIVVSVLREDGTEGQFRDCKKILPNQRFQVVDENSIHLATSHNPVYMLANDGKISVFPEPAATTENYIVYYVNNIPEHTASATAGSQPLDLDQSAIAYFPDNKVYLVVIYAAIQALQRAMGDKTVPSLTVAVVPPTAPTIPDYDIGFDAFPAVSDLVGGLDQGWNTAFGEEDLDKAKEALSMRSAAVKEYKDKFDSDVEIAKEQVGALIDRSKHEDDSETQAKLTLYQSQLTDYQQTITKEVEQFTRNLDLYKTEYQWLQEQYMRLKQQYDQGFVPLQAQQPQQQER